MKTTIALSILVFAFAYTSYSQCSDPNAGQDDVICGNTYDLSVENATTGYWSAYFEDEEMDPAPIFSPSNTSANVTVSVPSFDSYTEIVTFVWTDNSGPCTDTVLIEFINTPIAYAGQNFDVCGDCAILNADLDAMSGFWLANGASYDDYSNPNTEACVSSYGDKTFQWYVSNSSSIASVACTDIDEVIITYWRKPTPNILTSPADSTTCGLIFDRLHSEYPGSGITGYWYSLSLDFYWDDIDPGWIAQASTFGYHSAYWVEEVGPALDPGFCKDTAGPLVLHFIDDYPLYAGDDDYTYGSEYTLNALSGLDVDPFAECMYIWESENAVIDNPTSLETNVSVSEYGEYEFVLNSYYTNMESCSNTDTVRITFVDPIFSNIELNRDNDIHIYPNPVTDFLNIETENPIEMLEIYDINGKVLISESNLINEIDVSSLKSGIYMIKLETYETIFSYTFVKQ